jgi:Xaa-Pro dipeptidase
VSTAPNLPRARQLMADASLDAVVVGSPVNVRYLSGVHSWLDPLLKEHMVAPAGSDELIMRGFVVLPREGDPVLVLNSGLAANAHGGHIDDVRLYGRRTLDGPAAPARLSGAERRTLERIQGAHASAEDALVAALEARGLRDAVVGLEHEGVAAGVRAALAERCPAARFGDCSALLRLVRMVKTGEEIELLRRAAQISEDAAMAAFAEARPGAPARELGARFARALAACDASFDHFAYAVRGLSLATRADYVLGDDDCLCVDFGCIYEGYFSDSAVTLTTGELPRRAADGYQALLECIDAGIDAARPGTPASVVQAAMSAVLAERGVAADPPTGHGLGLLVRDWPIVVADGGGRIADDFVELSADLPLADGAVMNLEVSAFLPGIAALEVERTGLVTADGWHELVPQQRDEVLHP